MRSSRASALAAALAAALAGAPAPAAADTPVDLELVIAVDVSRSMDLAEQRLQRDGYVAAFRSGALADAIAAGIHGRIAVAYLEWAGSGRHKLVAGWTVVDGRASAARFADTLAAAPIGAMRRTSIAGAIAAGAGLFAGNGFAGLRRVIDVSGDGPNNAGPPVVAARDAAVAAGITINGLPLLLNRAGAFALFDIDNLDVYYEDCVVGGPGAFVLPVRSRDALARAIRRKLVREIAGAALTLASAPAARVDCLIGEKLWRRRFERLE